MLQSLRTQTKTIMWVVAAAFVGLIFLQWGMDFTGRQSGTPQTIGEVNGEDISWQAYQSALANNRRLYMRQSVDLPASMLDNLIEQQTWETVVGEMLMNQEAQRLGIQVTDADVLYHIQNNPPPEVRSMEVFQTDGRFDPSRYAAAMSNPSFEPLWVSIENYVRSYLPQQKLQERIWAAVTVTDPEAHQEFLLRNETVTVRYLNLGPESVSEKPATPSEEILRTRYEEGRARFMRPPRARVEYLVLPKVPDEEDVRRAELDLEDVQADLEAGVPFEDVAVDYSNGPAASRGGDIGWINRGDMKEKALEDAIFALQNPGDVSEPVRGERGFHLFQLVEKDRTRAHVRQILVATRAGRRAVAALHEKAKGVREVMASEGVSAAARSAGVEPHSTDLFSQGSPPQELLGSPEAIGFPFQAKADEVGGPFDRGDALLVMKVAESLPSEPIPFEEASKTIRSEVEAEERLKMARTKATEVAAAAQEEDDLAKVARRFGLEVKDAGPMTRLSPAPALEGLDAALGMCFALPAGETSPMVEDGGRFLVIRVKERSAPGDEQYAQQADRIKAELLQRKRQQAFTAWFQEIRTKAVIVDHRSEFMSDVAEDEDEEMTTGGEEEGEA